MRLASSFPHQRYFDYSVGDFRRIGSQIPVRPSMQQSALKVVLGMIQAGALKRLALGIVSALRAVMSAGSVQRNVVVVAEAY